MYIDKPLKDYLNDLSAKSPTPGGGSAAALSAAIGTSLMSMVMSFTIGKPEYREGEARVSEISAKVKQYDKELRELIDEDCEAYKKMSGGVKASGSDESAKDEAYKAAIEPPFLVCEIAYNCLKLCKELVSLGNRNLITDTAVAAITLEGAFFSAKFNVYINLENVKDTDYIAKVHNVIHPLEEIVPKLREDILEMCEDVLAGGR